VKADWPADAHFVADNVRLYLGDAIERLDSLAPASVDMIFADPPYNLSNDGFTCHAGKAVSVNKGRWDRSRGFDLDAAFHDQWIQACHRVLQPDGTLWISGTYHSIYACGYALQRQGWHLLNDIAWFKPNAAPNLSCRMFAAAHETLLWAKKSRKSRQTFNYDFLKHTDWGQDFIKKPDKQMRSVWVINTPPPSEKRFGKHPTQKPLALLERIVLATTRPGDWVLDPFCGAATTGVAAIKHGRRFIGIDAELDYLERLAMPRLKSTAADCLQPEEN
jgi:site-specific DNA-methyltransferase (adenine-specific)